MPILTGTPGNDTYLGTRGSQDTAVIGASSAGARFVFDGVNWQIISSAGTDVLVSIEQAQLTDLTVGLSLGGEVRVNTTLAGQQYASQITQLTGGRYVVTWTSSNDGSSLGVYSQTYGADGEPIGVETLVNTTTANPQSLPSIAALSDGGYVVSWSSSQQDGSVDGVYLQRYSAAGARVGGEVLVNTFTTLNQNAASVVGLAGGGFVVSWQSQDQLGQGYEVYMQRYAANGATAGVETLVNLTTTGGQTSPASAALTTGGYVITWSDSNNSDIYAQRYSATGVAQGGPTLVNSAVNHSQSNSAVTGLAAGKYVVTWETSGQDGSGAGIYAQVFSAGGVKIGQEIQVNTSTAGNQRDSAVSALTSGGFVVVWRSDGQDGLGAGIYAQRYDASGLKVGIETQISPLTTRNNPHVTGLSDGGYLVTWGDTSNGEVYTQRLNADGILVLPTITGDDNPNTLTAAGGNGVRIEGLGGNDSLTGGSGADILAGGDGRDILRGGLGDDTYIVDTTDRIVEAEDGGVDTAIVTTSYTITGSYLENVTLSGSAVGSLIGNRFDNRLVGNNRDNTLNGGAGADLLIGGGGDDTYLLDNSADIVIEDPGAGIDTIVSSVSYTLGANQENVRLVGALQIDATGNALDNTLVGNAWANTLDGGVGADVLAGDNGNDFFIVGEGDQVVEDANEGIDTVQASASWILADNVERLFLTDGGAYNGTGNDLANDLYGNDQANVLDGRGGADNMAGGEGADTYLVDDIGDVVYDSGGSTNDLVKSTVTHTLGLGLDNLTLLGTAAINGFGNTLNNVIRGNNAANRLEGGYGADLLYGGYGNDILVSIDGVDRLFGGIGDDTFIVSSEADDIVELASQGLDTVIATVFGFGSYTLGLNVENLVLMGGDVNGYGNGENNAITGTTGHNVIHGGAGADRMIGLSGNDAYVVDSASDVVVEAVDGGSDQILSAVTLTLGLNIEHLTLTGSAVISGTGNVLNNRLTGNGAANTLDGKAGHDVIFGAEGADILRGDLGNDVLQGGLGNDLLDGGADVDTASYYRATTGVSVTLGLTTAQNTVGAGIDTLVSIENLEGSATAGDRLTGNTLSNRLTGLGGDDILNGGSGNDQEFGGEGADTFIADAGNDRIDGGNGIDKITFLSIGANITVDLNLTTVQTTGWGVDSIVNVENIEGSQTGNDVLIGDQEDNVLTGMGGADRLVGNDGADTLDGGAGIDTADYSGAYDEISADLAADVVANDGGGFTDILVAIENLIGSEFDDFIRGSAGANVLTGGLGKDILRGGGGNDVFVYRNAQESGVTTTTWDIIQDFNAGDKIDLSLLDADTATLAIDNFTTFIAGSANFTAAGQLKLLNGVLYGNTDTDSTAEFAIQLTGVTSMTLSDIIL